jgi:hypothetical protein
MRPLNCGVRRLRELVARDDWCRRKSWSSKDEAEFFARLARSRSPFHKAQYLRIQAGELAAVGRPDLTRVALELLSKHLAEFSDPYAQTQAHFAAAGCHAQLGDNEEAVKHFRLSLKENRQAPHIELGTTLEFPWFVVSRQLTALYDEALGMIESAHIAFPVQSFKAAVVRAVIAECRGETRAAAHYAREALSAAELRESQFRYHRQLGLVGPEYAVIMKRLKKLAASQVP